VVGAESLRGSELAVSGAVAALPQQPFGGSARGVTHGSIEPIQATFGSGDQIGVEDPSGYRIKSKRHLF